MNENTTLIPLYRAGHGHTYRCSCCDIIQIEFDNASLCFPVKRMLTLRDELEVALQKDCASQRKGSFVKFYESNLAICYSHRQLIALHDLIDGSIAMLEFRDVLHDLASMPDHAPTARRFYEEEPLNLDMEASCFSPISSMPSGALYKSCKKGWFKIEFMNLKLIQHTRLLMEFQRFLCKILSYPIACSNMLQEPVYEIRFAPGEIALFFCKDEIQDLFDLIESAKHLIPPFHQEAFRLN
ncbi:MAG: hypothetical protein AAF564_13130 [Bacteroidota bacterium]